MQGIRIKGNSSKQQEHKRMIKKKMNAGNGSLTWGFLNFDWSLSIFLDPSSRVEHPKF